MASQGVWGDEADQWTLGRLALLCRRCWCVVGLPQDVIHTAMGPVVVGGEDLQHVCMGTMAA